MKKILLTIALSLVAAGAAFAQGQINFNNTSATLGRVANVTNGATAQPLVGTNYVAQLFFASDSANAFASAAVNEPVSLFRQPTTSLPGTWSGGVRTFVSGVNQGDTVNLIVRVWDGNLYNSYGTATAAGGATGQSASFSYIVPVNPPSASSLVMNNFQGFIVNVPEPSTIALGLLGAGSLLFLRRKK